MPIRFVETWNSQQNRVAQLGMYRSNHTVSLTASQIEDLIKTIPAQFPQAAGAIAEVKMAVMMDFDIKVHKGIHPDTKNRLHLLVEIRNKKYHINVQQASGGNSVHGWRVKSITSGK